MARLRRGNIAVLDIGTAKIACFIAEYDSSAKKMRIIGIGHQISRGVKAGIITDLKRAEASFRAAIAAAEQMASQRIERVFTNLSTAAEYSHRISLEVPLSGQELRQRDLIRMQELATERVQQSGAEMLHCFPIEYTLDGVPGIRAPEGMCGHNLRANMHVLLVGSTSLLNLSNCLAHCHLDIEQCIATAYASGLAVLEEDEKELGTMVLDIGGGQAVVGCFRHGSMIFADRIPLGGLHLTHDVAQGLSTTIAAAERIKILYGSVISGARDEQERIEVPLSGEGDEVETTSVPRAMLSTILQPRVEEILEILRDRLRASGMFEQIGKIVLTGGTSLLPGIKEETSRMLERPVRLGHPHRFEGLAESTKGPAFATSIGLLRAAEIAYQQADSLTPRAPNWLRKFLGNGAA
jgi:cell division protein FtsA